MALAPFHYEKLGGVMGGVMEREKGIRVLAKGMEIKGSESDSCSVMFDSL